MAPATASVVGAIVRACRDAPSPPGQDHDAAAGLLSSARRRTQAGKGRGRGDLPAVSASSVFPLHPPRDAVETGRGHRGRTIEVGTRAGRTVRTGAAALAQGVSRAS